LQGISMYQRFEGWKAIPDLWYLGSKNLRTSVAKAAAGK